MRLTSERSWAKMAAGSDLLDDVFFSKEVDEKVVSGLLGSLECKPTGAGHTNTSARVQSAVNHVAISAAWSKFSVMDSNMVLSQQELAKAGKIAAYSG